MKNEMEKMMTNSQILGVLNWASLFGSFMGCDFCILGKMTPSLQFQGIQDLG